MKDLLSNVGFWVWESLALGLMFVLCYGFLMLVVLR